MINGDGIPIKYFPDSAADSSQQAKAVQYAALIADLIMKTKQTLKQISSTSEDIFVNLRMRTKFEVEIIVTSHIFQAPGTQTPQEYILVTLHSCKFPQPGSEKN